MDKEAVMLWILAAIGVVSLILIIGEFIHALKRYGESKAFQNTRDRLLKQIRLKYENMCKLGINIGDMDYYVLEFMKKDRICGIKAGGLWKTSWFLQIFVIFAGIWDALKGNLATAVIAGFIPVTVCIISNIFDYRKINVLTTAAIKQYLVYTYRTEKTVGEEIKKDDKAAEETPVKKQESVAGETPPEEAPPESEVVAAINELFYELFGL